MGCSACVDACTYAALSLVDKKGRKVVEVNPVLCKGCGLCNSKCPTAAISLKHFTDEEILSEIDVMVPEEDIMEQIDAAAGKT